MQHIILAGGCFWCIEAVFELIDGVESCVSGYMGGVTMNPTYKDICTGNSGHAEVVKIAFNENKISLSDILEIFWVSHDPTTLNRQGNDIGTQYRSAVFYNNDLQKEIIIDSLNKVAKPLYENEIVTEIKPESEFYPAEQYHQHYYANHQLQPYCALVINPKINKIRQKFNNRIKQ
jgi:peptide-methionine (S)-S-oxide reductase